MNSLICIAALTLIGSSSLGQAGSLTSPSPYTEHTFHLENAAHAPAASLADVAWLVGSWEGEAFGRRVEEVWAPASGGTMVGLFKLLDDSGTKMYQIAWFVEEGGSLTLKLRHFHADLTAWEAKDEIITFAFVSSTDDAVNFDGLTYHRKGANEFVAYLALRRDGELKEETLTFRRVGEKKPG